MSELQIVMHAIDSVDGAVQSWSGLGAIYGIPWCLLLAMGASSLFGTFFSRR